MLEKNDMVLKSSLCHLEKIVNTQSTLRGECSAIESSGTKSSLQKEKALHLNWQDEVASVLCLHHVSVVFLSDLVFLSEAVHHSFSVMCVQHFMRLHIHHWKL